MSIQEQVRAIAPENKVAVGSSLQTAAQIMAGYADAGDKGVVGGYSGTFPLTAASQGGIYLVPQTGKFYVCETAYNGTQLSAPNSNFVELSVWKNHDRLNNLEEYKELQCIRNTNQFINDEELKFYTCYFFRNLLFISFRLNIKLIQLINKGEKIKLFSINLKEYNLDIVNDKIRCNSKLKRGNFDFEYDGTFLNIIYYWQNSSINENVFPYIYENIIYPLKKY